jgi:hypothetical protein
MYRSASIWVSGCDAIDPQRAVNDFAGSPTKLCAGSLRILAHALLASDAGKTQAARRADDFRQWSKKSARMFRDCQP